MDTLLDTRYKLELIAEIPDMEVYIAGWRKLAADFRAADMWTNAAMCDAKAEHYQKHYQIEIPLEEIYVPAFAEPTENEQEVRE